MNSIIESASRDFDVYLSNFSFSQLSSEFKAEKQAYFSKLSSTIDLLLKQTVSILVSITATLFALTKFQEQIGAIWFIFIGYFVFFVFSIFYLLDFNSHCNQIRQDTAQDFKQIKEECKVLETEVTEFTERHRWRLFRAQPLIWPGIIGLSLSLILVAMQVWYTLHPTCPY